MTGGHQAHPLLISLANILMDFRMKATNHAFLLLMLLPIAKFTHKDRKTCGILENQMIHECLDFILKPLKKAAKVSIMMSDPVGFCHYVFTPLGDAKIDYHFTILHPHTSFHQFNEGISRLKQVTGLEHCEIQHYLVLVIADAIPKDFLIAIRSLMDF